MVDLEVHRTIHQCPCQDCQYHRKGTVALDHQAINRVLALLDERQRRLLAGLLALPFDPGDGAAISARSIAFEAAGWLAEDQHDFTEASALFAESRAVPALTAPLLSPSPHATLASSRF